jgi:L-2-hydroxyglutarate oxidase
MAVTETADCYDFCVVGGGIVGLASAYALLQGSPGASLLLLEREEQLASRQTGHNSGVIHAGVYYAPGSLKARLCRLGSAETIELCREEGVAFEQCGKFLVATDQTELGRLGNLEQRAKANGLEVNRIDEVQLKQAEPNIAGLGALYVPASGIVDYKAVSSVIAARVIRLGGTIVRGEAVTGLTEGARSVTVRAGNRIVSAGTVVVCAGVHADRMLRMAGVEPDFRIVPIRGEYFKLRPELSGLVRRLIYPVPDPALPFLGVHLTRMIDGGVTVGPNAVAALSRDGTSKLAVNPADALDMALFPGAWRLLWRHRAAFLGELAGSLSRARYVRLCQKYAPSLRTADLRPYPFGVRAQAVGRDGRMIDDFLIRRTDRTIHVCNAPSPAATSALPIGRHVAAIALGSEISVPA